MSRRCEICGKGSLSGNKVSKSYNHTRRTWKPNIVEVKTEIGGTTMTIKMCTRCLRSGYVTKKVYFVLLFFCKSPVDYRAFFFISIQYQYLCSQ